MDTEMKHSQNSGTLARLLKVMKEERIANDSSAEEQSQSSELESKDTAQSHQQHTPWRIIWSDPSMEWELPALQSSPEYMWKTAPKMLSSNWPVSVLVWERKLQKKNFHRIYIKIIFHILPNYLNSEAVGIQFLVLFNMKTKLNNSS